MVLETQLDPAVLPTCIVALPFFKPSGCLNEIMVPKFKMFKPNYGSQLLTLAKLNTLRIIAWRKGSNKRWRSYWNLIMFWLYCPYYKEAQNYKMQHISNCSSYQLYSGKVCMLQTHQLNVVILRDCRTSLLYCSLYFLQQHPRGDTYGSRSPRVLEEP